MSNFNFHPSFQLNGKHFKTQLELITFSEKVSKDLYWFLQEWFSDSETLIVQTSGSTGTPKLVAIKKEFMKNSAKATGDFFNLNEHTHALCCLSTAYIAGKMMVIRALTLGWNLDVVEPISNPLTNTSKNYDFCAMVPMQAKASLHKLKFIKKLLIGGGVVSNELQTALQQVTTQCFASYGMTETVSHIGIKKLNHFDDSLNTSKNSISTVLDDKTRDKSQPEIFEHSREVNKKTTSKEHYTLLPNINISKDKRDCLVIEAPLLSDEKVITNDIVQLHSETTFEWLGRFDNVINSGGIKLHPEQIEKEISKLISQRFFVAGVKDETLGEKLILIVEGKFTEINLSLLGLSKFQIPKEIHFILKFVETKTHKINRLKTLVLLN